MFGTFMVVLDTTVVNVSLPHIAGSLSATIEESTWALTSYLAANAIILPITGWLANFFGRRRLLLISVAGFTAASLLCGLATSLPILILCRIVQGTTGGVMQPLSQAIMLEAFPPHERGKAMAFWGLGIVVAPILGPGARRLADRQLLLAVGLLHQPAGRHRRVPDDARQHLRPALHPRGAPGSTTGASACWPSGSGRCRSASTRGSRRTGSPRAFITILMVVAVVGARCGSSCTS